MSKFTDKFKADFINGKSGQVPQLLSFSNRLEEWDAGFRRRSAERKKNRQRKSWQAKYLGGYPDYPNAKSVLFYISKEGIEMYSTILNKPLCLIPWDHIQDVGQDLVHKQEQSALGSMAQGVGMMGAGSGGGLAAYSLQSAGQSSRKNVTEHYLEVYYLIKGIRGIVVFEFNSFFWNKRPVLEVIAYINKIRIENSKQV